MKAMTKIRRCIRAISPVISVLLMIAIAVAASLVAYAWMMGYIGGTTTKTGKAVLIQSMAPDQNGDLVVYVQNVGMGAVTVDSVYVTDNLIESGLGIQLLEGETATIPVGYPVTSDERVKVKVVTTDGTFSEITDTVESAVSVVQYQVDFVLGSGGLSMSPSGSQSYAAGAVVAISATPDGTHTFSSWTVTGSIDIDDPNAASTSATINGAGTITATFSTVQVQYDVDFVLGSGGASMSPTPGVHTYDSGASVAISATPDGTHTFSQWIATGSITFDNAGAASTTAHINGAGTITATFTEQQLIETSLSWDSWDTSEQLGDSVTPRGWLTAGFVGINGKTITLTFTGPGDLTHVETTTTVSWGGWMPGYFEVSWRPTVAGSWSVIASFAGDSEYEPSSTSSMPFAISARTLFSDNMQGGSWPSGWYYPTGFSGSYARNVNDGGSHTSVGRVGEYSSGTITLRISTTHYSSMVFSYDRRVDGLESGDHFYIQWSTDNLNWNLIEDVTTTSWGSAQFTLPAGAENQPYIYIRFDLQYHGSGGDRDRGYLDSLSIIASGYVP